MTPDTIVSAGDRTAAWFTDWSATSGNGVAIACLFTVAIVWFAFMFMLRAGRQTVVTL